MSFTHRHFFRILVVLVPVVFIVSCNSAAPIEEPNLSLQGFPTSEFFGGISVDLDGLQNHPRYQVLPLDELIPATTSFDYLDTELISQFAIFLKDSDESNCGSHQQFEIAAVGKLRNPDAFDVRKELPRWKNRTTPWRSDACEVKEVKIGNKTCYQFQTGTILNSIRRQGKLEFYDEDGKKRKRGINVGNNTKRGYTSGKKGRKAVVSLTGIRSADLIEGKLVLDLFLDVFETYRRNKDWCDARVYLQSSDGKLRSSLVEVKARSLVNHTVQFPRELPVFDTESGDAKGTVDLIDDFASDGEFQMVLQSLEKATYIGLKASDIGFLLPRHEYLGINGEFVVVAQSQGSLKQMLELSPQQLVEKIALTQGQQVSASFDLSSKEKLHSFKQFLTSLDMKHAIQALSPSTKSVRLSVKMDQDRIFSAGIGMGSRDAKKQARQITKSIEKKTGPLDFLHHNGTVQAIPLNDGSGENLGEFPAIVYNSILRLDVMASVRTMAFNIHFGSKNTDSWAVTKSEPAVFPNRLFDRPSMVPLYQKLFDDLASGVRVKSLSEDLAIEFNWPFKEPSKLNETDRLLLATLRRYRAYDHYQQKRFFLGEQIERRLIDEFPEEDGLWGSLSHQLTFNTSMEFDTDAAKYVWVRRGIEVLLDEAESNENSIDAAWMAATFIGWKIGTSDEEAGLRKLFADDQALHDRISKYVDLKTCVDEKGELDCMLVASQMLERCAQREDRDERVESKMGKLNRTALRIAMLRMRAERFDRRLQFEAANQQWQQVLVEWQQMGEQVVELGPNSKLKLSELKIDESVVGDDVDVEELEAKAYWYQVWRYTLKFRLSTDGRVIAKHIAKADAFRKEGDYGSASAEAKLALKNIRQTLERAPVRKELVMLLFGDFFYRAEVRYKEMDEEFLKELHGVCEEFGLEAPLFGTLR